MKEFESVLDEMAEIIKATKGVDIKIKLLNAIKKRIHEVGPFKGEPVDCVIWAKNDNVVANDYNPNKVAPPEMELLEVSIDHDGYTQPIVTMENKKNKNEVIDGFHRNRVGRESKKIEKKLHGYLPIVEIRKSQRGRRDRIASTIRHNRARGKHQVDAMSEIVLELKRRNWKNSRISKELGMDEDEILRLCQISGLEDIFKDDDFSRSWNIEDSSFDELEELTDSLDKKEIDDFGFRTINTDDEDRIFHTFDKWECYKSGFYDTKMDGMTQDQCEAEYAKFLSDLSEFERALKEIINKWKHSCEHYLTNKSMNRIAYLGQASLCYARGIPSKYRGGFHLLSGSQQQKANEMALKYLNIWLKKNGRDKVTMDEAIGGVERQVEIY